MDIKPDAGLKPSGAPGPGGSPSPTSYQRVWRRLCDRLIGGLIIVMPILITFWVMQWLYQALELNVIDPLSRFVLWKLSVIGTPELPPWFQTYVAPVIAILVALVILYLVDYLANSRLHRAVSWFLSNVPMVSSVYNPVQKMFQAMDQQTGEKSPQRLVLIKFPHPGVKLPAFVTAECKDIKTQKIMLCVYVPTTPVPTSGFFLLVPEEDVTELNWDSEQTLQAIMSGGLTAPKEVTYYTLNRSDDRVPSEVGSSH